MFTSFNFRDSWFILQSPTMKKQWEVFSCPDPLYNTDEKKVLSGCKSNGKESTRLERKVVSPRLEGR